MPRPKAQELPGVEGPGVSLPQYKDLDKLGDKFIEVRDEKAKLATKLADTEKKIIELMRDKGLEVYRFGDQEAKIVETKLHVKIKTVQVDGVEIDPDDEP